ncbi:MULTISPECIES: hypothetical protein [Pseudomonas]|uniref:Uncharacterized protein n=2 Tax=Pseudomonas TaxID=286 RepID=A0A7G8AA18_PSEAI|nr:MULTISPECIES: hypothetical protein [Pseudomonas]ALZ46363.1 Hypothetical protein [Pseudomonas putida]QNI15839.1 Hypothetical protein [Pseudomonas aeruginosa]QNI16790.1 Hypothetical protein [Pseudomonas aeruginosa]QNI17283.1 Hypothetical protein [Pseudomonas sp.]WHV80507.1 hypothetical protein M2I96_32595 [Pseudomonas aeruginosa]
MLLPIALFASFICAALALTWLANTHPVAFATEIQGVAAILALFALALLITACRPNRYLQ